MKVWSRVLVLIWLLGWFIPLSPAAARSAFEVKCTDSDGGLNMRQEGEVTVTAWQGDRVLFQQAFRDRNWLSRKTYIEFYCDAQNRMPRYKIIDCDTSESALLPGGSCPSLAKNSIMLEAKHASSQPKTIVESPNLYRPYYAFSLHAPAETIALTGLRLKMTFEGLQKSNGVWVKMTPANRTTPLGQALLAWHEDRYPTASVIVRFDEPLMLNAGSTQEFYIWLQGLVEDRGNNWFDNQVTISIESIAIEPAARLYFESSPRVNRYEHY